MPKRSSYTCITFLLSPFLFLGITICLADEDNLQDICPTSTPSSKPPFIINGLHCKNPANASPSDFKSTRLSKPGDTGNPMRSSMSIVTAEEFPGLNTLGLSLARVDLEVDGLVAPHSHARASEILFVSRGIVTLGFLDTGNTRFQKVLREGDVFVVPRGMLHYCFNRGGEGATVFSVLNSQNPGLVSVTDAVPGHLSIQSFLTIFAGKQDQIS